MVEFERVSALCGVTDLSTIDDLELLDAVRALEATYRINLTPTPTTDHRRYLSRAELETVFKLAQRVAKVRVRQYQCDDHVDSIERSDCTAD